MLSRLFGEDLFDEMFDDMFNNMMPMVAGRRNPLYGKHAKNLMKTDVRETEDTYEVDVDLPGFKKDELSVELKDGYLTIQATANTSNDEKDSNGRYIRRERHFGTCSRSFYVGKEVKQEKIKAKFEDGTLKLFVPKQEEKPAVEESRYITIEG